MVRPRKPDTKRADFSDERDALYKIFGLPPSDLDVMWSLLNRDRLRHAQTGQWGLYTNDTLNMADALFWTHRDAQCLPYYLEVCYLDLNNPRNVDLASSPELLLKYPPFSIVPASMAPTVLALAAASIRLSGKSPQQVKIEFLAHATKIHSSLHLPLPPDKAWDLIEAALVEVS